MKIISRTSERTLMRRRGEPAYQPFGDWEDWIGTEGFTQAQCERFIREQVMEGDQITGKRGTLEFNIRTPYEREQIRIVADNFNTESYNAALKE